LLSAKQRLAVIDNGIYAVSGRLPDGRVVERIDRDGVTLAGGGRRERLVWTPPGRVELRRQAPEPQAVGQRREWLDIPSMLDSEVRREVQERDPRARGQRGGYAY